MNRAYELGVRHFDTARSYGWGEAESVLGGFLSQYQREDFVLVSKCGIVPVKRSPLLSLAKGAARFVLKQIPASRSALQRVASSTQLRPKSTYEIRALEDSLEASLQQLKTSYLDVLLIHNFEPGKDGLAEVVSWLQKLKVAGRVKRYGFSVEGDLNEGLRCLSQANALDDCVVQTPVSNQLLALPDEWREVSFIAHSPFRYLESLPGPARLGFGDLLHALGNSTRCEALVCSMYGLDHIQRNVREHTLATDEASFGSAASAPSTQGRSA